MLLKLHWAHAHWQLQDGALWHTGGQKKSHTEPGNLPQASDSTELCANSIALLLSECAIRNLSKEPISDPAAGMRWGGSLVSDHYHLYKELHRGDLFYD